MQEKRQTNSFHPPFDATVLTKCLVIMPSSTKNPVTRDLLMNEKMDLEAEYWNDSKQIRENLDTSQTTLCMFRKYLFPKSRINSSGCTTKSVLPSFGASARYIHRPPTLLERSVLPGIRSSDSPDSIQSPSSPSQAQLTIFYAGVINVYDNVPVDKAQAIMLLAGETSLSKPTHLPNSSEATKSVVLPRSNSFRSSQSELPIARKTSLQHFLERRRHRITSRSPYSNINSDEKRITSKSPYSNKNSDDKERENKHSEGAEQNIYLSPFPSRFGFLFPASSES